MSNHLSSAVGAAALVCLVGGGIAATGAHRQANQDAQTDKSAQVFTAVCIKCHPKERVLAMGRTRSQWEEVINQMIHTRGAQISAEDFDTVLNYLTRNYSPEKVNAMPPAQVPAGAPTTAQPGCPDQASLGGGGGMLAGAGPSSKPLVDAAAADRGRTTWAGECINCHGTQAQGDGEGAEPGPLPGRAVRSLRQRAETVLEKGPPAAEWQAGRESGRCTGSGSRPLPAAARQRWLARLADLCPTEHPDWRCEGRCGLFQRRRQVRDVSFGHRQSCRHRDQADAD